MGRVSSIKRWQIRYANLGECEGSQQSGVRPVLIIQNDIGNKNSPTTIVLPLSSKWSGHYPFHVFISKNDYNIKKNSVVLCEQPRTIDKKFIFEHLDTLNEKEIYYVEKGLKLSVGL